MTWLHVSWFLRDHVFLAWLMLGSPLLILTACTHMLGMPSRW
jgi:hypothetical protein